MVVGVWLLLPVILLALPRQAKSIICYECASVELTQQWYLIGYPVKPSNFNQRCTTQLSTTGQPPDPTVQCDDMCVVVAMQAINNDGNVNATAPWWMARGCYSKFMGTSPKKATVGATLNPTGMREFGKLTIANKKNMPVDIQFAVLACKPTDSTTPCNNQMQDTMAAACTDATTCTIPASNLQCKTQGEDGFGTYCAKYDTGMLGGRYVVKGWANPNPFVPPLSTLPQPKSSICVNYKDSLYLAPGEENKIDSTVCYCNDNPFCNGSMRNSISILFVFVAIACIFRLM